MLWSLRQKRCLHWYIQYHRSANRDSWWFQLVLTSLNLAHV